ncbi:MAG: hypothetical protein C4295_11215 [Candidatus Fervidibacterota bacterium]
MRRPVTCRRCGKVITQGQVMGVWVLSNGTVRLQVHYHCPRCRATGYATLPPDLWAGATLVWEEPTTELLPEEMERFRHLPPITVDEVLDFYEWLQYIDRLPRALLNAPPSSRAVRRPLIPPPPSKSSHPSEG